METPLIRLGKHIWAIVACVVTLLAGAWLMLAPFALGYQGYDAAWTTQTINQFWLGLGVVLLSALGLSLFALALAHDLRRAGVMRALPTGDPARFYGPRPPVPSRPYPRVSAPPRPAPPAASAPGMPPRPRVATTPQAQPWRAPAGPSAQPWAQSQPGYAAPMPARQPIPSGPSGPSAPAGNDFERAVVMLAQSLAEDLAERRRTPRSPAESASVAPTRALSTPESARPAAMAESANLMTEPARGTQTGQMEALRAEEPHAEGQAERQPPQSQPLEGAGTR